MKGKGSSWDLKQQTGRSTAVQLGGLLLCPFSAAFLVAHFAACFLVLLAASLGEAGKTS